jgi:hypothetical protein
MTLSERETKMELLANNSEKPKYRNYRHMKNGREEE